MKKSAENLKFPLRGKYLAMLAPSFVVDFEYPVIINQLKELGFDKVVELSFGAKMINREYHKILKNSKSLVISSVCPGIVESIKKEYPNFIKNLILVDSPMIAMAKICRKVYPKHKIVFISPCHFKRIEAENSNYVDFIICYDKLREILKKYKIKNSKKTALFDKFYNDYTKIYPVSGGLTKTAHLKGILNKKQALVIDGISRVLEFLKKPKKGIKFLDVTFCDGSCIGGPCISSKLELSQKRKKVLDYICKAKCEDIPKLREGLIERANGICFKAKNL